MQVLIIKGEMMRKENKLNKDGFTLIELAVTISILSIVIVFLLRLINLFENNKEQEEKTLILSTNQSVISKYINDDVIENNGINSFICDTEYKCDITFNNGKIKTIEINNIYKTDEFISILNYYDSEQYYLRKRIPNGYMYNSIKIDETTINNQSFKIITIPISSHPEYNIEIISY